ncbi:hypothetical protein V1282_007413 [Nitrobacteraceae bacterium AZCC 2146]|jgi:hypothetical protein
MQTASFWRLYARLTAFFRPARSGKFKPRDMAGISVSPLLIFVAITLFLILAIIEIDQHRDELRAIGVIVGDGVVGFAAP